MAGARKRSQKNIRFIFINSFFQNILYKITYNVLYDYFSQENLDIQANFIFKKISQAKFIIIIKFLKFILSEIGKINRLLQKKILNPLEITPNK